MSTLYAIPPNNMFNMRIDKITTISNIRLTLLREFNKIKSIFANNTPEECERIYVQFASKNHEVLELNQENVDLVSFWTLKFAFSVSQEAADWHLQAEQCLLLARQQVKTAHFSQFLTQKLSLLKPQDVDFGPQQRLADMLIALNPSYQCTLKSDFNLLAPALASFKFPVVNSQFFITSTSILLLNLAKFSQNYQKSMQNCQIIASQANSVFLDLLAKIRQNRHGVSFVQSQLASGINAASINGVIQQKKIPLCAVRLIREMQKNAHLQYQGRLQLTTFLRDAGMSMEETILLFQSAFTAGGKITIDKFNKEYAYNIKHVYGQVGARKGAHCSGCERIIDQIPGKGQYHGCPFTNLNLTSIGELISLNYKCDIEDSIKSIAKPLQYKEYQSACNHLYFSFFGSGMNYIHPIQWVKSCLEKDGDGEDNKE
ncbi:DNA-directed DNA polymerase alpha, DNA primase subunit [Spironucleus salmonicida]|uniref:DNA-directed DNA polymerase alpha, DNA primase subunit n=1 Tax=Spironucleus salmonicida TaxID=348837 RepID=V6LPX9_9EUKA|nr:DNA-directed DNA polymerase alpha, DNA primase subunit [Spironucleus salmonicida]|eukprot:EST45766.1 DNA-directed DNA polymerase alpha, DNA primase subunit [Spironucleus salmonicida]